jgi:hypothetical protein
MATPDGSDPTLKFHRMDSPAAAPIGIHLRIPKNDKTPPICAFLTVYNKLPKRRTWVLVKAGIFLFEPDDFAE